MTQKPTFNVKDFGEKKRNDNIQRIRKLIQKGLTYEEIWRRARFYFTIKTFNEYYEIAKQETESEGKQN